jgi:hypothetical protein
VNERPQPPLPMVADKPAWLIAHGDETQLIVHRSPLVRDTNSELYPVVEHIERFGMVLIDRYSRRDPAWMFGECEASWYAVPQARIGLLAGGIAKLPR